MKQFTVLVDWPSAPLTDALIRKSLASLDPTPSIITSLKNVNLTSLTGGLLQWSSYDYIDHDLTHSPPSNTTILSSSYIIRKALIRKHYLSQCIHNYMTKYTSSVLSRAAPKTWNVDISFADELDEMWGDELWDLGRELEKKDPRAWWILKPGMADRGMGIRLFHTKDDLTSIFESFEEDEEDEEDEADGEESQERSNTAVVASQLRHFVIQVSWLILLMKAEPKFAFLILPWYYQEYLADPLLFDPSERPLNDQSKPSNPTNSRGHKVVFVPPIPQQIQKS